MRTLMTALWLASTLTAGTAWAQPFAPNEAGVTMGHWHLNSKDIEVNRKIFVGMGGTSPSGPGIQRVIFPGVVVNLNPGSPSPPPTGGTIGTVVNHVGFTVHDHFIGYPDQFVEPPVGFYLNESFHVMKAKADPHRFFLYRSDFLAGTDRLSPTGATRFNQMAGRLPGWLGPLLIEWTPDQPGLDRARRSAVLAALQQAGVPVGEERVVVAPSPYPGTLGTDAANYYDVMISRDQAAPSRSDWTV